MVGSCSMGVAIGAPPATCAKAAAAGGGGSSGGAPAHLSPIVLVHHASARVDEVLDGQAWGKGEGGEKFDTTSNRQSESRCRCITSSYERNSVRRLPSFCWEAHPSPAPRLVSGLLDGWIATGGKAELTRAGRDAGIGAGRDGDLQAGLDHSTATCRHLGVFAAAG